MRIPRKIEQAHRRVLSPEIPLSKEFQPVQIRLNREMFSERRCCPNHSRQTVLLAILLRAVRSVAAHRRVGTDPVHRQVKSRELSATCGQIHGRSLRSLWVGCSQLSYCSRRQNPPTPTKVSQWRRTSLEQCCIDHLEAIARPSPYDLSFINMLELPSGEALQLLRFFCFLQPSICKCTIF